jgi:guanine nucleotide-binding protein subunit alpha
LNGIAGAGESGKSTVLKQMRMIYAREFSDEERRGYRAIVLTNVLSIMQILIEIMDNLDMHFEDPSLESYVRMFEDVPITNDGPFPQEYLEPLKRLWNDPAIQRACLKGNAFALHDNCDYFYQDLDRIWGPEYVPTDRDIIHCRAKSTGITETVFHLGPLTYRMFDLGGQRSERKKWIHCFDKVTSILFIVAMSGYDQCLIEDRDSVGFYDTLGIISSFAK